MKIIAVCGFIGAGKSTVANYLVEHHGFVRLSFAAALKDVVAVLFGWDRARLEGLTPDDRAWREQPDPFWSEKFGKPWTPRWALQYVGTEVVRNTLHQDMWVLAVEQKLRALGPDAKVVFDDARFVNELRTLQNLGADIVVIDRDTCFTNAHFQLWVSATDPHNTFNLAAQVAASPLHASEKEWLLLPGIAQFKQLHNNSDYPSLYTAVDQLISEISS